MFQVLGKVKLSLWVSLLIVERVTVQQLVPGAVKVEATEKAHCFGKLKFIYFVSIPSSSPGVRALMVIETVGVPLGFIDSTAPSVILCALGLFTVQTKVSSSIIG